jgi:type IV pilus assembly protein PilC
MTYKYTAYSTDKKIVHGTLEVASESIAEGALYRAGFERILSLKETTPGLSLERLLPSFFGVKTQEVIDFANQLATLVASGVTILMSLDLLAGQTRKKVLKQIIIGLTEEIREGGSLSQALGRYPKVFPDTYRQVIKASEQTGRLEVGLRHAAGYTEKQSTANQKIQRAMAYPAFVLLMAAGVSVLLITIALPPLVELFKSLHAQLPWTTRWLMGIMGFVLVNKLYLLAGVVAVIILVILLLRLASVQTAKDRLILKIPVIGTISIERSMQQFCQTTAMLLTAGLRLPQIMEIVVQANRNRIIRQALSGIRDRLVQGEGLAQPMSESGLFPPLLIEMMAVGEKTGAMDTTLATRAEFYEKKIDRSVDLIITMIEPTLTVLVGLVVIFIALSVITPLYSILKSMH